MLFPTFTFAAFFAIVLPISWLLRDRAVPWKLFVLGASYWFYAAWDRRFVLLLVAMTLVNAAAAHLNSRSERSGVRKALVSVGVGFDLVVLGFFKYYGFFTQSLDANLGISSPALSIVLPVGISFFTFQAISYVVDVHRRKAKAVNLLDFAVYLSFFPQLVAGPIVRATEFMPQMRFRPNQRRVPAASGDGARGSEQLGLWADRDMAFPTGVGHPVELGRAAQLIGRGMFKKVVVADFLAAAIVDDAFASPDSYGALDVLFGVYGYAVQIYADFSGYTDMAIGVALLMGFRFPQNFDRPYAAVSVRDFWRRWHMTLSRWLRDYLYIPLGGSRRGRVRTYINLLVTMGLGGLWHGAAGVFIVWGLYQGAGLAAERVRRRGPRQTGQRAHRFACTGRCRASRAGGPELARAVAAGAAGVPFRVRRLGAVQQRDALAGRRDLHQSGGGLGRRPRVADPHGAGGDRGIGADAVRAGVVRDATGRARLAAAPTVLIAAGFAVWTMIVVALGPEGVADYIYFQF